MIAGAGLRTGRLILKLSPLHVLTIELIPCHGPYLLGNDGSVALSVGRDEKFHRRLARQNLRPLNPIHARHGRTLEAPIGPRFARLGIPVEPIRVAAHSQNVRRFVDGNVDIVLDDGGRCRAGILVELDLIETKVDGTCNGTVVVVKVARDGDGQGRRSTEAGGRRSANVKDQIGTGNTRGYVFGGYLGELGITAVATIGKFGGTY
mmetsp:Transcript_13379/g.28403  ORF Transcript_13379/g.28403 Transcript_13379/m.28403 type:complete len:206 (-) Transcript_13379:812-1429(-)